MILDEIVAHKKKEVAALREVTSLASLKRLAGAVETPRGFRQALARSSTIALIAEVKKSSPSAGLIRKDVDPVRIGKIYEDSGASAISVLTDEQFFDGSLAGMREVKQAVSIPVLRKDFIIDPFQIYEARAFGADAVLLIVAILYDDQLRAFLDICKDLGLDALVEIHTEQERDKALEAGADLIGINNRDLKTFAVDLSTTIDLVPGLPKEALCVSESGIKSHDDIRRLMEAAVDAVLVGTVLMEADDIGAKIKELLDFRL